MLGIIGTFLASVFIEIGNSIGRTKVRDGSESTLATGFRSMFWGTIFFLIIKLFHTQTLYFFNFFSAYFPAPPSARSNPFSHKHFRHHSSRSQYLRFPAYSDLTSLASGSLGGVWGCNNKIWDVAAGLLLAELAGAEVKLNYSLKKPELVSYTASVPTSSNFITEKTSVLMK
ncbi:MAG TPA: hypothetical protein VJI73_02325 [Candidatus Paceibacterota bacterium]